MGKTETFPDGSKARPVDQAENQPIRHQFYLVVTGKTVVQMKAYWAKVIFTGDGRPPQELADSDAVKQAVARDPEFIGYIESNLADSSVKILLQLPEASVP